MAPEYAEYGSSIAKAFQKYLKTGDERIIEKYSVKELRTAVSKLSPFYNTNKQWYRQLERRIEYLSNIEETQREKFLFWLQGIQEKWLGKIISFLLGITLGIAL